MDKTSRSNINIPFTVGDNSKETISKFLHFCFINNIVGLKTITPFKSNRIEPLRISLYNGITIEETEHFIQVMKEFEYMI